MPKRERKLLVALTMAFLCFGPGFSAQQADPSDAARRARELVAEGKLEQAIFVYQELVRAFPDNAGMIANLAVVQYKAGKYAEAIASCEAALRIQPGLFPALLFLGASRLELGDAPGAVEPLRHAAAEQPGDRNARLMLGDALLDSGDAIAAGEQYRELTRVLPSSGRVWYGLARAYDDLASEAFHKVSDAAPDSGYDLALAGDFEFRREQYPRAYALYRRAQAAHDDSLPGLHDSIAAVYDATGHADWAAAERGKAGGGKCEQQTPACAFFAGRYAEVAAIEASGVQAEFWKSRAYARLAQDAYTRLAALPPCPEMHEAAAEDFERKGKYREAAAEWQAAITAGAPANRIQRRLGFALLNANDPGAAAGVLEPLVSREPDSAELNFLCGSALLAAQNAGRALAYLERAVKAKPSLSPAHGALGEALLQLGKPEQAIPELKAALADDADGVRHYQFGRALRATGRDAEAAAALKQSNELREQAERNKSEPAITPP